MTVIQLKLNETLILTCLFNDKCTSEIELQKLAKDCWLKYKTNFKDSIRVHGKEYTLERYKEAYQFLSRYHLNLNPIPLGWSKIDRNGIPKILWPLRSLINHTDDSYKNKCIRMSLIIARIYETIYLKPQPNYLPITSKGNLLNPEFIRSFDEFTKDWFMTLYRRNERLTRLSTKIDKVISSTKKGPNGPALVMSHIDSKPVCEDKVLFKAIKDINTICGNTWITRMLQNHYKEESTCSNLTHSRINYVAEGGGKTRIFAIGDYWSQMTLKGIHNFLMEILRSLKTDATHDQNAGFTRVLKESKGKQAYSYDLSGASDRIPLELQKVVLKHAFNNEDLSESWSTVIADREFQTPTGEQIRWEVGQPLGLLSSWPSFALWHHIFVQYCAFRCGISTFREYEILGDDVVIWNKAVGDIYSAMISEIGIPINKTKSVISCNGNTQIEFAKRIALNGIELSGLNYNITNKSELTFVNPLIEEMYSRGLLTHTPDHFGIEYFRSSRRNTLLSKIVSTRYRLLPSIGGNNTSHITALLLYSVKRIRKQLIQDKLAKLDSILMANKPLEVYFNKAGCQIDQIQLGNSGYGNPESLHPLVWAINAQGEELAIALSLLEFDDDPSVAPVEYLPIVGNELFFKNRKMKESQWFTSTLIQAYDALYDRSLISDSNL